MGIQVDTLELTDGTGKAFTLPAVTSGTGFGAVIVPVVKRRDILHFAMVRQHRHVIGKTTLEFPRGGTADLSVAETLRELVEETGLIAPSATLMSVMHTDTGLLTDQVGVWRAYVGPSELERVHVEPDTGAELVWLGEHELSGLLHYHPEQISCSLTVAALHLFRARANHS